MAYNLAELDSSLAGTLFAGRIHFAASTGSTNTDALHAARNGAPHGSVYLADEQTAGRGRGGHAWQSNAGQGLYMSALLRPVLPLARLPLLPLAAGLAAMQAIQEASGLTADLRWPNDVLLGPRKAGGILVESRIESGALAFAVAGVGINVHQREFPAELATQATSLDVAAGRVVHRQSVLAALLKSLERELLLLAGPGAETLIPERLRQASTWICGRRVHVHGPQTCTGVTDGLDEHGFLRVRTAEGIVCVQTGGVRAAETD
ncbi:MAG TPA: biotin--[acetyl-CoA-carboxylase] ligase [Terracidiphilus sp.]|nr:biotin--[acetyl-CoA-carboxylase] ligase [Terracidiphilus sp.]